MRKRTIGRRLVPSLLAGAAIASIGTATPSQAQSAKTIEFVVDSSGSMDELGDTGQRRIDTARTALNSVFTTLGASDRVGMRVYGPAGDCFDGGRLEVPIQPLNTGALRSAANNLAPSGNTPTPAAILAAIEDLQSFSGTKQIVLLSDGESTCGDPCGELRSALYGGINVVVHTVGFFVNQSASQELACLAAVSGGSYFPAPTSAGLSSALNSAARSSRRFDNGSGASLIQLLVNAYAHEDWGLARTLNPARRSLSNSEMNAGWGGMEEAWVFPIRERRQGRNTIVDSLYITNEVVVPELAKKTGWAVGSYVTQTFCITWTVNVGARTVQERAPKWSDIRPGYLDPQEVARRAKRC
jgi:hypothetical protein